MKNRASCLLQYALLLIVVTASSAFALPGENEGSASSAAMELAPGADLGEPEGSVSSEAYAGTALRAKFYQAINQIYAGHYGTAGKAFDELKQLARNQGYVNLPDYSVTLLSQAKLAAEEGRPEEVSFLLFQAVELSPKDPRIQFTAASFYREVGIGTALKYALGALSSVWNYPLLLAAFLANLLLVGLIAGTCALFLTCIIQLVRNGSLIFSKLVHIAPRTVRGFLAPIALLTILIAPLFAGILGAISCWSLVLARVKQGCRWFPALCSTLIFAWAAALTILGTVGFNLELRANRVLEEVGNLSFSPEGERFLKEQLAINPDAPLLRTVFGQVLHMQGQYSEAADAYESVLARTPKSSGLNIAARMNMAAIAYRRGDYESAKNLLTTLEQEQVKSFELYYNLALTHSALLDTVNHRAYYLKARKRDEARLDYLNEIQGSAPAPVVSGVPTSFYLPLLNSSVAEVDPVSFRRMTEKQATLAASLMRGGSVQMFLLTAGLVFLLGLSGKRKRGAGIAPLNVEHKILLEQESSIWLFLPAGLMAAGERPAWGAFLMTLFLILVFFALETPMNLYPALPLDVSFRAFLIAAAVLVFVASAVLSVALRHRLEAV